MTLVKKDFLDIVIREADINIREYVNERRLKKHEDNFLEVVHFKGELNPKMENRFSNVFFACCAS